MPPKAKSLFKTGRVDCVSKQTDPKFQYLAPSKEIVPDQNGNGPMTRDYFDKNFGLDPREGLVLMGAHTLGSFSTFAQHIDYAWVSPDNYRIIIGSMKA